MASRTEFQSLLKPTVDDAIRPIQDKQMETSGSSPASCDGKTVSAKESECPTPVVADDDESVEPQAKAKKLKGRAKKPKKTRAVKNTRSKAVSGQDAVDSDPLTEPAVGTEEDNKQMTSSTEVMSNLDESNAINDVVMSPKSIDALLSSNETHVEPTNIAASLNKDEVQLEREVISSPAHDSSLRQSQSTRIDDESSSVVNTSMSKLSLTKEVLKSAHKPQVSAKESRPQAQRSRLLHMTSLELDPTPVLPDIHAAAIMQKMPKLRGNQVSDIGLSKAKPSDAEPTRKQTPLEPIADVEPQEAKTQSSVATSSVSSIILSHIVSQVDANRELSEQRLKTAHSQSLEKLRKGLSNHLKSRIPSASLKTESQQSMAETNMSDSKDASLGGRSDCSIQSTLVQQKQVDFLPSETVNDASVQLKAYEISVDAPSVNTELESSHFESDDMSLVEEPEKAPEIHSRIPSATSKLSSESVDPIAASSATSFETHKVSVFKFIEKQNAGLVLTLVLIYYRLKQMQANQPRF